MKFNGSRTGGGQGKNRSNYGSGLGNGGACICPQCGTQIPHRQGQPCYQTTCPQCGSTMSRDAVVNNDTRNQKNSFTKRVAIIDKLACIGCGKCVPACPYNAIKMVEGKAVVDNVICKGCMVCQKACPVNAIS